MNTALPRRLLLGTALAAPWVAPSRTARAATAPLRAGDQKGGLQTTMKAAGVLDGLPFAVEWNTFPAAAPVLEALNAGAVDLAYAGDAPTSFALANGLPGHIISASRSTGAGTAILVKPDSPIRTAADLKGRTVAANRGSIAHHLILALTEAQGWPAGSIRMANLLPAEAKSALASGAVDAWCSWGIYVAQAKTEDKLRVVADGSNGLLPSLGFITAADSAIAARRTDLAEFARRYATALRWAQAHPAEYAHVFAGDVGVAEPAALLSFQTDNPGPVAVTPAVVADEQKVIDRYHAAGLIRTELDARKLFDASFTGPGNS